RPRSLPLVALALGMTRGLAKTWGTIFARADSTKSRKITSLEHFRHSWRSPDLRRAPSPNLSPEDGGEEEDSRAGDVHPHSTCAIKGAMRKSFSVSDQDCCSPSRTKRTTVS